MNKTLMIGAALSLAAAGASAGEKYPYSMEKNGILYKCEASTISVGGKTARRCIVAGGSGGAGAGVMGLGTGLGIGATTAAVIGGVVIAGAVVASNNDDDDSTTGTN